MGRGSERGREGGKTKVHTNERETSICTFYGAAHVCAAAAVLLLLLLLFEEVH
jgi:hypothetical protein